MEHVANAFPEIGPEYLKPTGYFDYGNSAVAAFAAAALDGASSEFDKAIRLFYAVRDRIRYDPYRMSEDPDSYRASNVIEAGAAFCIPKANLLIACARAAGIPAGLGLSNVTNHLCTERLLEMMGGSNLFVDHGYAVLHLDGMWVKAAPTFNIELCDKFDVTPTDFDGTADALFQEYDRKGRRHMDYVADHGVWSDFPYERVIRDFRAHYPEDMYDACRRHTADSEARAARRFEDEQPLS